ncbi:MAG: hypothetical protein ABIS86_01620 [Streptosporangiaceae bacterium]
MRANHPIPALENIRIPVPGKEVPVTAPQLPKPARNGKKDAHLKATALDRGAQRRNARRLPTRQMNGRGRR